MKFLKKYKSWLITIAVGIILGLVLSWVFRGKPAEPSVKIERDTIVMYDTIPSLLPKPKDSVLVKWVTVSLPIERPVYASHPPNDSLRIDTIVAELPITQKHYQEENYQAWVSGYMPNLDSIEVYQKTSTITETITITQQERMKHWGLGFTGGCNYKINDKEAEPYAGLEVSYRNTKWGASASSGYIHNSETKNGAPYVNIKFTYNVITF